MAGGNAQDIRLLQAGDGSLAIATPKEALTSDLAGRLKPHKDTLLTDANALPQAALDLLEDPRLSPRDLTEALWWPGPRGPKAIRPGWRGKSVAKSP